MRRREFVALLGAIAAALPLGAIAQPSIPLIGFISNGSKKSYERLVAVFRAGLAGAGYEEGRNVAIEYRWAEGENGRLPDLVQDLVRSRVVIIVATGGTPTVLATKEASARLPVVFAIGADPVKLGLVASLNRPGGNMTGVSFLANTILAKQVEILHEIVGKEAAIGFLVNPSNPNAGTDTDDVVAAANTLGRKLIIVKASTQSEIEAAFSSFAQAKIGGLLIFPDALFTSQRDILLSLLRLQKLPAVYNSRDFAIAGGLIGYGARQSDAYRQAGVYAGRILKGEKPADLPVVQSTSIELVVNLNTAKSLGITVPLALLGRADEVIE
jgi:putative ABC transport system substrate-binding protein